MTHVSVDVDRCTGHGRCYSLCPEVFDADDMGHSVLRLPVVPEELEDNARIAVETCPENALSIT